MTRPTRPIRGSLSLVISILALVVALSGTAYAALADGSVDTRHLANGAVTKPKIASNAVTSGKIAPEAVSATDLRDDVVRSSKVLDGSLGLHDLGGKETDQTTTTQNLISIAANTCHTLSLRTYNPAPAGYLGIDGRRHNRQCGGGRRGQQRRGGGAHPAHRNLSGRSGHSPRCLRRVVFPKHPCWLGHHLVTDPALTHQHERGRSQGGPCRSRGSLLWHTELGRGYHRASRLGCRGHASPGGVRASTKRRREDGSAAACAGTSCPIDIPINPGSRHSTVSTSPS